MVLIPILSSVLFRDYLNPTILESVLSGLLFVLLYGACKTSVKSIGVPKTSKLLQALDFIGRLVSVKFQSKKVVRCPCLSHGADAVERPCLLPPQPCCVSPSNGSD